MALGPVVRLKYAHDSFLGAISFKEEIFQATTYKLGVNEIFGKSWNEVSEKVCIILPFLCHTGSYLFVSSSNYCDLERASISSAKWPSGSSVKQLIHFAQLIKDKSFQKYDYRSD